MEQRRFQGRSRRRTQSNLNPSAHDFVPRQYDETPGTSQSGNHHGVSYDGRPPGPGHREAQWQDEDRRRNAEHNNRSTGRNSDSRSSRSYDDNRDNGRRNQQQGYHQRPNFRQNSFGNVDYSQKGHNIRNSNREQENRSRPFQNEQVNGEPSFDFNRREPRNSHYSSNSPSRNIPVLSSGLITVEYPSNALNRRNASRTYDVRYDSNYQDTFDNHDEIYNTRNSHTQYGHPNNHDSNLRTFHGTNGESFERQNPNRSYENGSRNSIKQAYPNRFRKQNHAADHNEDDSNWRSKNSQRNNFKQNSKPKREVDIDDAISNVVKLNIRDSTSKFNLDENVTSQREKLVQILFKGTQECLVCCEKISQVQSVWSCGKCYNILHLKCTIQWSTSSYTEQGWRCPACQNVTQQVPTDYQCFCKKQILNIGWNRTDTPHSCGEVCNKDLSRGENPCGHRCTLLCHPGPCPVCEIVVTRFCGCGQTNCQMQCGSSEILTCTAVCQKLLNCIKHQCEQMCHDGSCAPCDKVIDQTCYCGVHSQCVTCKENVEPTYSCEGVCNKTLECGSHTCSLLCHPGPCDMCYLMPQFITTCCCGKTHLTSNQKRDNCTDPIPTCDQICGKMLHCGDLGEKHKCQAKCHESDCPPCILNSIVLCNCKQRKRQMKCSELKPDGIVKCNIKCSVMRSCRKHKCNQTCCTSQDHICPLVCNKKLRCGTHKCEHLCHQGQCPACMNVSFEELTCICGGEVIFPPVPCGTKRPLCGRVCSREHPCSHPPQHSCHDEPECPPCVVFTEKWCYGHHQLRKNIFCNVQAYSCGQACGRVLKCQRHFCNQPCHEGDCLKANEKCKQVCTKPRPLCGHPCNEKCHPGVCPGSTCMMSIQVTCSCGERSETQACIEDKSLLEQFNKNANGEYRILECNELCAQIDRNRRLALGLQIRNPDLSLKLKPLYPDFLKQWGKKDPEFCNFVHGKLADLVKLCKESKQKSRSFSFEVMNRDKRQFIHGYCEFFGITAVDCDPEPKRNVMITAFKDRAWLPGYSLMETLQREKGQLKAPMLPNRDNLKSSRSEMVQLGGKKS